MDYQTIENQQQANINQGQKDYQSDVSNAQNYQNQYNADTQTAQGAQQKVSDYSDYLQGAGSGANVYAQQQTLANKQVGYDPQAMQQATNSLTGLQGALASANQAFSTPGGVNYAGLTAPAAAQYANSIMNPLQTGISAQGNAVANLNELYKNSLTQAQQGTGAQLQTEKLTQDQLQNSYTDANQQTQNALNQMQYYQTLAQSQQGLNANQLQGFYTARAAYAQAQQALQTANNQIMRNQMLSNVLNSSSYQDYLKNPQNYNVTYAADGTPQVAKIQPTNTNTGGGGVGNTNKNKSQVPELFSNPTAQINQWGSDVLNKFTPKGVLGGLKQGILKIL